MDFTAADVNSYETRTRCLECNCIGVATLY